MYNEELNPSPFIIKTIKPRGTGWEILITYVEDIRNA
jgi:hypothetical protein